MYLKQSTSVVIPLGPFVSVADGATLLTGLVSALDNGTTGIKLSKNGGAQAVRHATVTATTYDTGGVYLVTLDTTDTNTIGMIRVAYTDPTTCLPVWQDFHVLAANVYDALFGAATVKLQTDAVKVGGTVQTAADLGVLPSAGAIVTAMFARTYDATKMGAITFEELTALSACVLFAIASGMDTSSGKFRNLGNTLDAVAATLDAYGNRSAVTLTKTAVR